MACSAKTRELIFRFQCAFELVVWLVGAGEVGVTDEEAFPVVVGVDEPAGDVVGGMAADLAGCRIVDVDPLDFDQTLIAFAAEFDIGLAEDHKQIASAGLFEEFVTHAEIGVHAADFDAQLAVVLQV